MKIIIDRNTTDSRQSAVVEIDTKHCHYPYAIRESIELALELDGYSKETINEVFGRIDAEKRVQKEGDYNNYVIPVINFDTSGTGGNDSNIVYTTS